MLGRGKKEGATQQRAAKRRAKSGLKGLSTLRDASPPSVVFLLSSARIFGIHFFIKFSAQKWLGPLARAVGDP